MVLGVSRHRCLIGPTQCRSLLDYSVFYLDDRPGKLLLAPPLGSFGSLSSILWRSFLNSSGSSHPVRSSDKSIGAKCLYQHVFKACVSLGNNSPRCWLFDFAKVHLGIPCRAGLQRTKCRRYRETDVVSGKKERYGDGESKTPAFNLPDRAEKWPQLGG